jgi:hypothetical protein
MPSILPKGLPERTPSTGVKPIARVNLPDMGDIGGPLRDTAKVLREQADLSNRNEYNDAERAMIKTRIELTESADQTAYSPDFGDGIDSRPEKQFEAKVNEALSLSASKISDPNLRAEFIAKHDVKNAESIAKVNNAFFKREGDYLVAKAREDMDLMSKDDDINSTLEVARNTYNNLREGGYISAEQAQIEINNYRDDLAVSRLKSLSAGEQKDVIKSNPTWLKNIPADVVKSIADEADDELRLGQAQEAAYGLINAEIAPDEAGKILYQKYGKTDPELYRDAKTQFDLIHRDREVGRAEQSRDMYNELWEAGDAGMTTERMRTEYKGMWAGLTVPQKKDLLNNEANRAAGIVRKHSDRDALMRLKVLEAQGDKGLEIYNFVTDNHSLLSPTDYDKWSSIAATGLVGEEIKTLISIHQKVKLYTDAEKLSGSDVLSLTREIDTRYFAFTDREKRNPTAEEAAGMYEEAIKEHKIQRRFMWDKSVPSFKADNNDRIKIMLNQPNIRQQFAYAAQFDQKTEDALLMAIYKNANPELFADVMGQYMDYTPSDAEALDLLEQVFRDAQYQ